jgi:hypothetical protein
MRKRTRILSAASTGHVKEDAGRLLQQNARNGHEQMQQGAFSDCRLGYPFSWRRQPVVASGRNSRTLARSWRGLKGLAT